MTRELKWYARKYLFNTKEGEGNKKEKNKRDLRHLENT